MTTASSKYRMMKINYISQPLLQDHDYCAKKIVTTHKFSHIVLITFLFIPFLSFIF